MRKGGPIHPPPSLARARGMLGREKRRRDQDWPLAWRPGPFCPELGWRRRGQGLQKDILALLTMFDIQWPKFISGPEWMEFGVIDRTRHRHWGKGVHAGLLSNASECWVAFLLALDRGDRTGWGLGPGNRVSYGGPVPVRSCGIPISEAEAHRGDERARPVAALCS